MTQSIHKAHPAISNPISNH